MIIGNNSFGDRRTCKNGHASIKGESCAQCARNRASSQSKRRKAERRLYPAARYVLHLEHGLNVVIGDKTELLAAYVWELYQFEQACGSEEKAKRILDELRNNA